MLERVDLEGGERAEAATPADAPRSALLRSPDFGQERSLAEPMQFASFDGTVLAGTVTRPFVEGKTSRPVAGIVIASGSGPQPRDGVAGARGIYRDIAEAMSSAGVAAYRFDDRGVGESEGSQADATIEVSARDFRAAVAAFSRLPYMSGCPIGVLGHSAGAALAAAAAEDGDLAFVVLLAPPGLTGTALVQWQFAEGLRRSDLPENVQSDTFKVYQRIVQAISSWSEAVDREALHKRLDGMIREYRLEYKAHDAVAVLADQLSHTIDALAAPPMTSFLKADPLTSYRGIPRHLPVLVLYGDRDVQVSYEENHSLVAESLSQVAHVEYHLLREHNHLFQSTSGSGHVSEYQSLPNGISDEALGRIRGFLLRVARGNGAQIA